MSTEDAKREVKYLREKAEAERIIKLAKEGKFKSYPDWFDDQGGTAWRHRR